MLAALPEREHALLAPHFERLTLSAGQVLYEPGQSVKSAYFPEDCVFSLACDPVGGRPVEVAMIGPEGFVGIDAIQGVTTTVTRCLVQTRGTGTRVPTSVLAKATLTRAPLRRAVARWAQALQDQTSLCAACNVLHSPRERCARWLLMVYDRVDGDEFSITQEVMAFMLGTARQTVSAVAQEFEERGVIEHGRARLRITDRAGLEALACDCYWVVADRMREILEGHAAES